MSGATRWIRIIAVALAVIVSVRAADLNTVCDQYYEDYRALFPVDAAANGDSDHRYDDVWPDEIGVEHRAQEAALVQKYLAELGRLDQSKFSASDRLSYEVLKWSLDVRSASLDQPIHLLPVNQFTGAPLLFAQMASGASLHPFRSEQDYRNFIKRAQGFSRWVDSAIANMRLGVARGIVQPRVLMARTLPQHEALMVDDAEKNILFAPLKTLPAGLEPTRAGKLRADYLTAIRSIMIPAYARLHEFIKTEYLAHCRETAGIGALPGGKSMYAYWVRYWTTTNRTPEEIHQLGLSEVSRIRGEMDKVRESVGFNGSLAEFVTFVTKDPKFAPFTTDEEVLDAYRAIEARITPSLPKLFGRLPRTKFEIRATEKFRVASAAAEYQPASADGTRPGVFYVPIVDPKLVRTPGMEDLFLHEAIPGHHFQFSITLERPDLPRFRRFGWSSAYGEGWALYTESLGKELGVYTDPYQYLGTLLAELHRSIRLVVDTGIHAKGWTREQALAYAAEQEGEQPRSVSEIERYMAAPGQALSYKIGQLKIIELRTRAEKKLGAKFDVRAFHDLVLTEGSLPLAVLESNIDRWIAAQ
ncbi:MAG: DUF885 domain-containing protein [Opitutus sp.]